MKLIVAIIAVVISLSSCQPQNCSGPKPGWQYSHHIWRDNKGIVVGTAPTEDSCIIPVRSK